MRSREARNAFSRLAELSVHGANVQKGQIVLVQAEIGLEEQARATAEAAYKRGAKFVDVAYFDPYLKRVRIENAHPDTLDFVPQWYGERVLEHAEQDGARINLRGVTAPNVMDGLDKSLLGKDRLPSLKESLEVIDERSTNWCFVPAPHSAWAALVHPDLPADEAYQQLWRELEHVLRLDEPDPLAAWDERIAVLSHYAARLTERRFDAIELRELALVDGEGRIGPLGTVFYNTLLDENASSHIALGNGFPFLVGDDERERGNASAQHIDFMIGSAELDVDGVTADGRRVPILRNLAWQLRGAPYPVTADGRGAQP